MATHQASSNVGWLQIPRARGVMSGLLLVVLGAWAAVVAFVGPYMDFAYTPKPNTAWHWTAARGWLEVLPGAAVFVGGLLLIFGATRLTTLVGAWLGVAGGAWLIVGPPLATVLSIDLGTPDPASSKNVQALEQLFFFSAIGAAILFVASVAVGRLTVRSVRDVRVLSERQAVREEAVAAEQPVYNDREAVDPNGRYQKHETATPTYAETSREETARDEDAREEPPAYTTRRYPDDTAP